MNRMTAPPIVPLFDSDTHDSLALRFTGKYAATLRYCAAWDKWLIWDGRRWKPDTIAQVRHLARKVCRDASAEMQKPKVSIKSAPTAKAVEWMAQSDPRHATEVGCWDADLWLLNTPEGTVDLRTGKVRPNEPDDYLTKITAVAPGGDCPTWKAFLARVLDGDGELVDFLQRMCGYALTGVTREHALFFCYGTGGNGKGTFLNTVTEILGDYASVANIDTFTASNSDRHSTELAMMRGARLVSAQETEEGRRWAESRIKAMTGGDPITARFMYQDFFTYTPQFKLIIAGNHKPGLRNVDEAIRRRLHLVPFTQTIPESERDPRLTEKLRAEWPGILAWMVEGCRRWQTEGLMPPTSVREATDDYLADEDRVQAWLDEACDLGPDLKAPIAALYASFKLWAERSGERPRTKNTVMEDLRKRGFTDARATGGGRCLAGLALKPVSGTGPWWERE